MFEYEKLNNLDIIVYCGGKCGSSTLHNTFKKNGFKSYKIHTNNYFKYLCNTFKKDTDKSIFDVIDFNIKQEKNIYIIDSYRNPIERKISSFFQNIHKHITDNNNKKIEELIKIFNEKFLYELEENESIDEVMKHYGLDTFTNFDFNNKYNIVKKNNLIFIKIRFNDICEWSNILSTIFEKNIEIYNSNLTNTKPINKLYNIFKEHYRVPEKYLNEYLINNVDFNIYNTEDEKNKYINYWKNKIIRADEKIIRTCVYVNVKNEKRIIEFIKYYIKIGINYFIILDDDSDVNVNEILIKNGINKDIYEVIYTNGRRFHYGIYNSSELWDNELLPILNKNYIDYVLYVDADEFLYIGKFKNIKELIIYYQPFDCLKINWLIFGSNKMLENNTDSIITQFNKSSRHLDLYVKCLTKVSSICTDVNKGFHPNPHVINVNDGITKNIYNEIVTTSSIKLTEEIKQNKYFFAPIYIAHYMCQDIKTYIERKICSKIFLHVSKKYNLTDDVIKLIKENITLFMNFLEKDKNNNYEIDNIYEKTTLPKEIIVFLKDYFNSIDNNNVINNNLIKFF
jgi:hypothetical protein